MMQELNYIRCGDYYIPDIRLPEETRPIGRWGRMHRDYIKEHNPIRFNDLCLSGELWTYLADLNEQVLSCLELIIEQMKAAEDVTESMKQQDQMAWVRMDVLVDKFKEYVNSLGIVGAQCSVNEAVADKMADTVVKVEDLAKKSGAIPHLKVEWDKPHSGAAQISCLVEYLEVETAQFFEAVKDASEIYFDSINDESFMMTLVFRNAYNYEIYHLNNP